jgi:hypothetical protein
MQEPKILFFLAVWKRPEITELCFMGLQRLMKRGHQALAVISEKSMIPLCKKYGVDFCEYENRPLGRKKNFGLNEAMKRPFDYIIELGSDDIIADQLLDYYVPLMKAGEPFFGSQDLLFVDGPGGVARSYTAVENHYGFGFGLGRCMSRSMLEAVSKRLRAKINSSFFDTDTEECYYENSIGFVRPSKAEALQKSGLITVEETTFTYRLWSDDAERMLDNDSNGRIMGHGFKYKAVETPEPLMADIKSDENIWGYNPELGEPYDIEKFLGKLSADERAMFWNIQKKLKAKRIEKAA